MKRILTVVLLCILFLILDNTLMPLLKINGVYPSLLFTFALCYSIVSSPRDAVIMGVFAGALQDVYFLNAVGINMLSNMLMCFVAANIGKNIFIEKSFFPIISSFVLSLVKGLILFSILFIIKQDVYMRVIIYQAIYNLIISIFMYKFTYKLSQKEYMKREWEF
ncbi:rod shape-determining protein MreD [Clostridium estertheticum]|uniref:rod shape-determining protein MreD n=1 Tax=Clostridium estertheticum TaxID=238834 RepID=UPI001C7CA323|nr:rod shape-determining protein MreD [Clostridium estertheticum]MBX4258901.1 rod shape-determining protein MreD [Clostridium estertheticum]WLC69095.1 rod shape-determining protein MreD [Clostridium estertheticum]